MRWDGAEQPHLSRILLEDIDGTARTFLGQELLGAATGDRAVAGADP